MLHRTFTLDDNETVYFNVSWEDVRASRDQELKETDWWALKDLTMSQAKKDYRKFLRDLPQNYYDVTDEVTQGANAACDAWSAYDKPE